MQVRNLCKSFGRNGNRIDVLKETSFDLYRGESVGILGRSGCGKSTLARCIAGLEKVDSGSVVYHGRDITDLRGKRRRWVCGKLQRAFGFAVVMISHDMRIVRHFCQRAAIMNDGRFAEIVPAERLDPSGDRALAKSFADGAARVRARP